MKFWAWLAVAIVAQAGWCQTATSARYNIDPAQVAAALSSDANRIATGQVKLLAEVTAAEANPALELLRATSSRGLEGGPSGSLVTIGCRKAGACLPFYALVESQIASPAPKSMSEQAGVNGASHKRQPIVMRAGTHATLMLDSARAQIRLAVVSLESGAAGSRIRVSTPDHKEVYEAEVVGPNLLKGSF